MLALLDENLEAWRNWEACLQSYSLEVVKSAFKLRIQSLCPQQLYFIIALAHKSVGSQTQDQRRTSTRGNCKWTVFLWAPESVESSSSDLKVEVPLPLLWMSELEYLVPSLPTKKEDCSTILTQLTICTSICPIYCYVDVFSNHPQVNIHVPLFQSFLTLAPLAFWVE